MQRAAPFWWCLLFCQNLGGQYWKRKLGSIMSSFWGWFFHVFRDKKCSVPTKKFHKMKLKKNIFFLQKIEKMNFWFFIGKETFSIMSCSTWDTSQRDFSTMTLYVSLTNRWVYSDQKSIVELILGSFDELYHDAQVWMSSLDIVWDSYAQVHSRS